VLERDRDDERQARADDGLAGASIAGPPPLREVALILAGERAHVGQAPAVGVKRTSLDRRAHRTLLLLGTSPLRAPGRPGLARSHTHDMGRCPAPYARA